MESSDKYNPFGGPGTPPEMASYQHTLELLREIIENEEIRGPKQGGIFRKPTMKTCHNCKARFLFGCNHCRLCKEIFCNQCCMKVSAESVLVPLYSDRKVAQKKTIKLCLHCHRKIENGWQTFNIQESGYHHIVQNIDALKRDVEKAINSYNNTVTEIRQGTKLVASRRLIDERKKINDMLSEFDDNIYKLSRHQIDGSCFGPAQYSAHFEQYKTQLDHFKNSIVDGLNYWERGGITIQLMCSHFCCCLYRCCKSPYGEYIDEDTVAFT